MKNKVLVSIIINNYNYSQFLSRSIESAICQSYSKIEIIIVDDGSTDCSRDIMEKSAHNCNVVNIFKKNGGQASAFNEGFKVSHGELIIFLDSDDILDKNIVRKIVNFYDSCVSKIQYFLEYVDVEENSLGEYVPRMNIPNLDAKYLMERYGSYPSPPTSGNAWSRFFLEKIMPLNEEEWRISADSYLIAIAPFHGNVVHVPVIGGMYRVHSANNFYNDSVVSKEWLLRSIDVDFKKCKSLIESAFVPDDVLLNNVSHLKSIVALKRLYSDGCPYSISVFTLVRHSLRAVCLSPWLSVFSKIIHYIYFVFVFIAPVRFARIIIYHSIFPAKRLRILRRWI